MKRIYLNLLVAIVISFNGNCITIYSIADSMFALQDSNSQDAVLLFALASNRAIPSASNEEADAVSDTNSGGGNQDGEVILESRTQSPTLSPLPQTYTSPVFIELVSSTPNASVYFTVDGSEPTASSELYSEPIHIYKIAGKQIRAKAISPSLEDSEEVSAIYGYSPLRTGQSASFENGDDGASQNGTSFSYSGPNQHPIYSNDYTTVDNVTGLIWRTCRLARSGADCENGSVNTSQFYTDAVSQCNALNSANSGNGYAGRTDWRLPTQSELFSLMNLGIGTNPTINSSAFPNTTAFSQFNSSFWTGTTFSAYPDEHYFYFNFGGNFAGSVLSSGTGTGLVQLTRCVAGEGRNENEFYFTDNGDFTVTDNRTGLTWTKCSRFQSLPNCSGGSGATDWTTAMNYCRDLDLAGKTWRLPNIRELYSLVDASKQNAPYIRTSFFPNTLQSYWSSTTRASSTGNAWTVSFNLSGIYAFDKALGTIQRVRCVAND